MPMPPGMGPPMGMPPMGMGPPAMPVMPMMPPPMRMPGTSTSGSTTSGKIQFESSVIKAPTVPIPGYDTSTGDLSDLLQDRSQPSSSFTDSAAGGEEKKKKKHVRIAGGTVWEDNTLEDWAQDDFRLFVGDIGNEVTDDALLRAFNQYPSLLKAKIIRDKKTKKTKGYGFISFEDP